MRSTIVATSFGIAAILMAIAIPQSLTQVSMAIYVGVSHAQPDTPTLRLQPTPLCRDACRSIIER
jgi:hypothetical protein